MNIRTTNAATFAEDLARHLEGWSAEALGKESEPRERCRRAHIIHNDGARVCILNGFDKKGRWSFFGIWPYDQGGRYRSARDLGAIPYDGKEPRMTAALERSPKLIASQFRRQIEADVLAIHAKCVAAAASSKAWHDRRREIARELAQALGGELRGGGAAHDHHSEPLVYLSGRAAGSINLRPSDDSSVRIEGYMTVKEVLAMAPALNPVPDGGELERDRAERLQRFARTVLHVLTIDSDWQADTLQEIAAAAQQLQLAHADEGARFRAKGWALPGDRFCRLCGQRERVAGVDRCEECQEIAGEIDDALYGAGEVQS